MKIYPINSDYNPIMKNFGLEKAKNKNKTLNNTELQTAYYLPIKNTNQYQQAVPFKGINAKGVVKQRGMFMHITSLPGTRSFAANLVIFKQQNLSTDLLKQNKLIG